MEDVHKSFAGRAVLRGARLAVEPGEILGLIGANGSGKTTILRLLSGLCRADRGAVTVLGGDPARGTSAWRAALGVLLEEVGLYPRLSARDNLALFAALYGLDAGQARARADALLEALRLGPSAGLSVAKLSKGGRKLVGIARALLHQPRCLLLDEPFEALDPISATGVIALLEKARAGGATLVLCSHELAYLERLCTRVAMVSGGGLVLSNAFAPAGESGGTRLTLRVPVADADAGRVGRELLGAQLCASLERTTDGLSVVCGEVHLPRLLAELAGRGLPVAGCQISPSPLAQEYAGLRRRDG